MATEHKNFLRFGKRIRYPVQGREYTAYKMAFLSISDIDEMTSAWNLRREEAFKNAIEDDFVHTMLHHVPENLKAQMMWAIHNATAPVQLQVSFGVQFDINHTFKAEGWGERALSIKKVLYQTNALERIAQSIGPNIKVSFRFVRNSVHFTIDFWPPRPSPHIIHDPEDVYADMPGLEPR